MVTNAATTTLIGLLLGAWWKHRFDKKLEAHRAALELKNSASVKLQEQRADAIRRLYSGMTAYIFQFSELTARISMAKSYESKMELTLQVRKLTEECRINFLTYSIYFNGKEASTINGLLNMTREFEARCNALAELSDTFEAGRHRDEIEGFIKTKWVPAMEKMVNEFQRILGVTVR